MKTLSSGRTRAFGDRTGSDNQTISELRLKFDESVMQIIIIGFGGEASELNIYGGNPGDTDELSTTVALDVAPVTETFFPTKAYTEILLDGRSEGDPSGGTSCEFEYIIR